MSSTAILSQGVGYAVVLGIGLFFSLLMVGLTAIQNRYSSHKTSSASEYTSASHSVKPGLIASGIVSAWTWAATLLQSSAVAYKFGISGPWWYAAGATIQILLFAQNAAKLKLNAPNAHTFTEVIRCRWGQAAHGTFLFFGLATNIIVTSMLMTGGSATVTDLTGMSTPAACMLIPVGVVVYVLVGGMRASLLADYIHTTFLFAIILTFMFVVYTTSPMIGSPGAMYDQLVAAAERNPIAGNAGGSYLTMRSKSGLIFGVINIVGNFATVFNDQAYWQRAIASQPVSCVKAFCLGGSAWLSIPLGFATTMGLSAVVLTTQPSFPGYPEPLSASAVGAGLPAPSAAAALLGKGGAALMLILLFLAVTSALSAELVAVSSLFTYDLYVPYINPKATEKQILAVDHIAIVVWGLCSGVLGVIFFYAAISMGWLYEFMGVVLGGAVCPIALSIMSSKANKWGCVCGAWIGLAFGIIAWLVTASTLNNGEVNIDTTFQDYPMLAGNLASLGVSGIISVSTSLIWPENFNFDITRALHEHGEEQDKNPVADSDSKDEKTGEAPTDGQLMSARASVNEEPVYDENKDPVKLRAAFRLAVYISLVLVVVLILLIPLPLFFSSHIYPKAGFYVWVAVAFIWVFYGSFAVVLYPIYESRDAIGDIFGAMMADLKGKRTPKAVAGSE
ncbi:urea transporter [Leucosporidium creatinivorum]|uniref:Urea transporter n=1 Tax=Leucosporidium creatinivorum TaxID=106004 RepID=A0A1Y2G6C4_9BASI|nr:urea transporter [Leucosporidium creatinivorum]